MLSKLENPAQYSCQASEAITSTEKRILGGSSFQFASEEVVRGNCTEITLNGQIKGVSTVYSTDNVEINLWRAGTEGRCVETYELTKLPNWAGIKTTTASVKLPRTKEEAVEIILNKAASRWSDFADSINERFPAIVRRNQMTLKKLSVGVSKRSREVEDGSTNTQDSKKANGLVFITPEIAK
jgi:hypothetical protein